MVRKKSFLLATLFCLASAGLAIAQDPGFHAGPGPDGFGGPPPMERAFHDRHFGRWWNDPQIAQQLALTDQQKKQMDQIFLQHRLNLIDLNAKLEKQQVLLGPMIEADQPDETKILAQIDTIAQARADLEKANARMLFDLRKTLTPDQWKKLKTLRAEHRNRGMGRDGGPGMWRQHRQFGQQPPQGPAPNPQPDGQPGPPPPPQ